MVSSALKSESLNVATTFVYVLAQISHPAIDNYHSAIDNYQSLIKDFTFRIFSFQALYIVRYIVVLRLSN